MSLGAGEVTFEFKNFTASTVGANSPLLGWIRLDADLNKILATFQVRDFLLLDLGLRHRCLDVLCIVVMLVCYVVNCYVVEGLKVREPLVYIEYTRWNCAMN
ncbi:hypothetical protein E5676_scaffold3445G00160 [Cucumis melo var. makuwa]|uniref:Uncharacterized protein n=1 Tax=Cucumis melo var. makuwa TaxID=1194695 RepID=A0A5D3DV93_CUCMM|nr:hypothetical protein E6C27_scaffold4784G00050 [Cucumis melo var. makuwa]TYK27631.1 hypothetical protein E5676_scaffold3445G00160 [Cucumis melo var. makuwa]